MRFGFHVLKAIFRVTRHINIELGFVIDIQMFSTQGDKTPG